MYVPLETEIRRGPVVGCVSLSWKTPFWSVVVVPTIAARLASLRSRYAVTFPFETAYAVAEGPRFLAREANIRSGPPPQLVVTSIAAANPSGNVVDDLCIDHFPPRKATSLDESCDPGPHSARATKMSKSVGASS